MLAGWNTSHVFVFLNIKNIPVQKLSMICNNYFSLELNDMSLIFSKEGPSTIELIL